MDTVVMVNGDHPAWRRSVASRSEGYHLAVAVATALAPLVAESANGREFLTRFLAQWGEAADRTRSGRTRATR